MVASTAATARRVEPDLGETETDQPLRGEREGDAPEPLDPDRDDAERVEREAGRVSKILEVAPGAEYIAGPQYLLIGVVVLSIVAWIGCRIARAR